MVHNPNLKSHLLPAYILFQRFETFLRLQLQKWFPFEITLGTLGIHTFTFSQLVGVCLRLGTSCSLFFLWSWAINLGCSPFPPRSIQLPSSQGHFFLSFLRGGHAPMLKSWHCVTSFWILLSSLMFINSFIIKNRYVWIARIVNQRTTCKNMM